MIHLIFLSIFCSAGDGFQPAISNSDVNLIYLTAKSQFRSISHGLVETSKLENTFFVVPTISSSFCNRSDACEMPLQLINTLERLVNDAIDKNQEIIFTGIGHGGRAALAMALSSKFRHHQENQIKIVTFPSSQIWDEISFGTKEQKQNAYQKFGQKNILRFCYNMTIPGFKTYDKEVIGIPICLLRYETMSCTKLLINLYSISAMMVALYYSKHKEIVAPCSLPAFLYLISQFMNSDCLNKNSRQVLNQVMTYIRFNYNTEMCEDDLDKLGNISIFNSHRGLLQKLPI